MYAREYRSTRPHKAIFFHLSCLTLICSAQVYAKPDMRPLGPNIADKGSVFYHFSVTSFDSVDGTRHYRVWTAVPNTTAPASGYLILYMLTVTQLWIARMTNCSNNCQKKHRQ